MPKENIYRDSRFAHKSSTEWATVRWEKPHGTQDPDFAGFVSVSVCMSFARENDSEEARLDVEGTIALDRDGINRMIRTLRRARDQAFGRDE